MDQFDLEGSDATRDLGRHRTLALENGNKVHFKCHDPFGFWTVNFDKGQMPDALSGHYTSFEYAEKAVRAYLQTAEKPAATETQNAALKPEVISEVPANPKAVRPIKPKIQKVDAA